MGGVDPRHQASAPCPALARTSRHYPLAWCTGWTDGFGWGKGSLGVGPAAILASQQPVPPEEAEVERWFQPRAGICGLEFKPPPPGVRDCAATPQHQVQPPGGQLWPKALGTRWRYSGGPQRPIFDLGSGSFKIALDGPWKPNEIGSASLSAPGLALTSIYKSDKKSGTQIFKIISQLHEKPQWINWNKPENPENPWRSGAWNNSVSQVHGDANGYGWMLFTRHRHL